MLSLLQLRRLLVERFAYSSINTLLFLYRSIGPSIIFDLLQIFNRRFQVVRFYRNLSFKIILTLPFYFNISWLPFLLKDAFTLLIFTTLDHFYYKFIPLHTMIRYLLLMTFNWTIILLFLPRNVPMLLRPIPLIDLLILLLTNRTVTSGTLRITKKIITLIRISINLPLNLLSLLPLNLKESINNLQPHLLIILNLIFSYSILFHITQ